MSDIERAKQWFYLNKTNLSKTSRTSSKDYHFDKEPDWSNSIVHSSYNGMPAVEVALDYQQSLVLSEEEITSQRPNAINSMLLFEVQPNDYEIYLLKIYPDNPNIELSKKTFTK